MKPGAPHIRKSPSLFIYLGFLPLTVERQAGPSSLNSAPGLLLGKFASSPQSWSWVSLGIETLGDFFFPSLDVARGPLFPFLLFPPLPSTVKSPRLDSQS